MDIKFCQIAASFAAKLYLVLTLCLILILVFFIRFHFFADRKTDLNVYIDPAKFLEPLLHQRAFQSIEQPDQWRLLQLLALNSESRAARKLGTSLFSLVKENAQNLPWIPTGSRRYSNGNASIAGNSAFVVNISQDTHNVTISFPGDNINSPNLLEIAIEEIVVTANDTYFIIEPQGFKFISDKPEYRIYRSQGNLNVSQGLTGKYSLDLVLRDSSPILEFDFSFIASEAIDDITITVRTDLNSGKHQTRIGIQTYEQQWLTSHALRSAQFFEKHREHAVLLALIRHSTPESSAAIALEPIKHLSPNSVYLNKQNGLGLLHKLKASELTNIKIWLMTGFMPHAAELILSNDTLLQQLEICKEEDQYKFDGDMYSCSHPIEIGDPSIPRHHGQAFYSISSFLLSQKYNNELDDASLSWLRQQLIPYWSIYHNKENQDELSLDEFSFMLKTLFNLVLIDQRQDEIDALVTMVNSLVSRTQTTEPLCSKYEGSKERCVISAAIALTRAHFLASMFASNAQKYKALENLSLSGIELLQQSIELLQKFKRQLFTAPGQEIRLAFSATKQGVQQVSDASLLLYALRQIRFASSSQPQLRYPAQLLVLERQVYRYVGSHISKWPGGYTLQTSTPIDDIVATSLAMAKPWGIPSLNYICTKLAGVCFNNPSH